MREVLIHHRGRMASQFHADFFGHSGVGQNRINTMAQRMERALGKNPEPLSPDRHRIETSLDHDAFEILGKPASAARYLAGQLRAQKASGAKRGYEISQRCVPRGVFEDYRMVNAGQTCRKYPRTC